MPQMMMVMFVLFFYLFFFEGNGTCQEIMWRQCRPSNNVSSRQGYLERWPRLISLHTGWQMLFKKPAADKERD
jgi:hypothetical protein